MASKILKFEASWCGQCKVMTKNLSKLQGRIEIQNVDVETSEGEALAKEHNVVNLPTLIFIKDGVPVYRLNGIISTLEIENRLKEYKLLVEE